MQTTVRIYRAHGTTALMYSLRNEGTKSGYITKGLVKLGDVIQRPPGKESFERAMIRFQSVKCNDDNILFKHPPDISSPDILAVFSDAAYDYRSASLGHGSIVAACLWCAWAMPSGGWFVVLFKKVALPLFASYGAVRFFHTHSIANSAEQITEALQQGRTQFMIDDEKSQ